LNNFNCDSALQKYFKQFTIICQSCNNYTTFAIETASARYRPPELLHRHAPTQKSDMWSMGVTALEALTGIVLSITRFYVIKLSINRLHSLLSVRRYSDWYHGSLVYIDRRFIKMFVLFV